MAFRIFHFGWRKPSWNRKKDFIKYSLIYWIFSDNVL